MSVIHQPKRRWDTSRYMRIADARYCAGKLFVTFDDGTDVSVDVDLLVPSSSDELDWNTLRPHDYFVTVSREDGDDVEISWLAIRALTDAEFNAHLAATTEEDAKQIGRRLQGLRERQNLSRSDLAARSGVAWDRLARIEHGRDGIDLETLDVLLASMGHGWSDLRSEPTTRLVDLQRR